MKKENSFKFQFFFFTKSAWLFFNHLKRTPEGERALKWLEDIEDNLPVHTLRKTF